MRLISLLVAGCGIVFAAALPQDTEGVDPALLESWSLAQATEIFNTTAGEDIALEGRGLQKRACYDGGMKWTDRGNEVHAKRAASYVCWNRFAGTYQKNKGKHICLNLYNNMRVDFELGLFGSQAGASRYISGEECLNGMMSEFTCAHGGKTTYGNWYYRADPNDGYC